MFRSPQPENRFALICGSGGVNGVFIAGVLSELYDSVCDLAMFETITATSASAGGLLHYLSYGRGHKAEEIWVDAIGAGGVIHAKPLRQILRGRAPLDLGALMEVFKRMKMCVQEVARTTTQRVIIPLLNIETNEIEYWENERIFAEDMYKVLEAAKAAPILVDRMVEIGGMRYMDPGGREEFVWTHPRLEGVKKLVVLCDRGFTRRQAKLYRHLGSYCVWQRARGWRELPEAVYRDIIFKPGRYMTMMEDVVRAEREGEALVIMPEEALDFDYAKPIESLRRNFNLGRQYVRDNRAQLMGFLGV